MLLLRSTVAVVVVPAYKNSVSRDCVPPVLPIAVKHTSLNTVSHGQSCCCATFKLESINIIYYKRK